MEPGPGELVHIILCENFTTTTVPAQGLERIVYQAILYFESYLFNTLHLVSGTLTADISL